VVYARTLGAQTYTFQVSGKLWRNSFIMEDRETSTSWSHVTGRALGGPGRGARLQALPSVQTTWAEWKKTHPRTELLKKSEEVLSSHYQKYFEDPDRMGLFRAQWLNEVMPGKTLVWGATLGVHAVAVTDRVLTDGARAGVDLGGTPVVVERGPDGGVRAYAGEDRDELPVTRAFWFAWSSFYPNTQVVDGR
jgi:hypothetical protein